MEFISTQNYDSDAERVTWEILKTEVKDEVGFCWHKHPVTSKKGTVLEPDFVILSRKSGLIILEAKGCTIHQVERLHGYFWMMASSWYERTMEPFGQARAHRFAISDRMRDFRSGFLSKEDGSCKIPSNQFVVLPEITEEEWDQKFSEAVSNPKDYLIFKSDIESGRIKEILAEEKYAMNSVSDEDWDVAVALMTGGEAFIAENKRIAVGEDTKSSVLQKVEEKISRMDIEQHKVAVQIPDGPQRIRGLAGTGKTVVLAMKAAQMHVKHPDWEIAFTYYTRSLTIQIKNYISKFYKHILNDDSVEPDWSKIHILHGWGASKKPGLYRAICDSAGFQFRNYTDATSLFATNSGSIALDKCCQELLAKAHLDEIYDAILIDEAQDFSPNFFRMCYKVLKQPKRLVWGYDELQSLDQLEIPTAEKLFGLDASGNLVVDLEGSYPGDIEKDMVLFHCYRNPRPVLIAAHTFGMGLYRKNGAIQFIDSAEGWKDIGYEVQNQIIGKLPIEEIVTISRPHNNSPHLLESLVKYDDIVRLRLFDNREEEIEWFCSDLIKNVKEQGIRPEDIAIIALDARKKYFEAETDQIREILRESGIRIVTGEENVDSFNKLNCVTLTSVFRAKGNEAPLVYVYGFENIHGPADEILQRRNRAFAAMTRAKGWLTITGAGAVADQYFDEIRSSISEIGKFTFLVPDSRKIQRNLETFENQRRRKQKEQAQKSIKRLITDLKDVDPSELSPEDRKLLIKLLMGDPEQGQS
jgi:superfamily I DNA and RNA helicase